MAKSYTGSIKLAATIKPTGNQPLDDRVVVNSYSDLLDATTFGTAVYKGMLVAIAGTNQVYSLVNDEHFLAGSGVVESDWERVGGDGYGVITTENYSSALTLATQENIGQIIYVENDEEDTDNTGITYNRGLYVVVGEDTLLKLAESSASGDIEEDVKNILIRLASVENKQKNDDDNIHIIGGDDIE